MAAHLTHDQPEPITAINITPFVDIILVVLIAFMVTSTMVASRQIPVELPEAATGEAERVVSLALVLTASGQLYLDGRPSSTGDVRAAIRRAMASNQDVACLIGADGRLPYQDVMSLVDLIRQEGVDRFGFQVADVPVPDAADAPVP